MAHPAVQVEQQEWQRPGFGGQRGAVQIVGGGSLLLTQAQGLAQVRHEAIDQFGGLAGKVALPASALYKQLDLVRTGLVHGAADAVVNILVARPVVEKFGLVELGLAATEVVERGVKPASGFSPQLC